MNSSLTNFTIETFIYLKKRMLALFTSLWRQPDTTLSLGGVRLAQCIVNATVLFFIQLGLGSKSNLSPKVWTKDEH